MTEQLKDDLTLVAKLFADLRVVQSQQSEINRRIGRIETIIDERLVDPARVAALEAWQEETAESRSDWVTWVVQTVVSTLIATGSAFGITLMPK